jgi:4-hydroxybenzoate polyprenyltransferase
MRIDKIVAALLLFAVPALGFAAISLDSNTVPEPETLALFAGAAIAWAIVRWKNRK